MQFQQDSATAHTTHNSVLIWMGCLVIGLHHVVWSASAHDFHLWDNMNSVYKNNPHTEENTKKSKSAMGTRVPSQG
jgi:hypothetical protein